MANECSICAGRGVITRWEGAYQIAEVCVCTKDEHLDSRLLDILPEKFAHASLEAGEGRGTWLPGYNQKPNVKANHQEALALCQELKTAYQANPKGKPGLLLSGNIGVGKTHLVCALLADLIRDGMEDIRFVEAADLQEAVKGGYGAGREDADLRAWIQPKILVIDDLGRSIAGKENASWAVALFTNIINGRYNRQLPTLITTNLELSAKSDWVASPFQNWAGPRMATRLKETSKFLILNGVSCR